MTHEQSQSLAQLAPLHHLGTLSSAYIAEILKVTPRHARRLLNNPQTIDLKIPWNRIGQEVRNYITQLKQDEPKLNCQWIGELTSDHFSQSISRSSVWRILNDAQLLIKADSQPTVRSRFEARATGDLIQMDTTWGYWLEGQRLCLILLLDDYSRYILYAQFFREDSAYNNMQMITRVVRQYGAFKLLYTDNASFFKPIRHNQSFYQIHKQEEYESEITRACRQLGITHITHKPYQPQSKGKIERLFRFIQERLISQFPRQRVDNLDRANVLLWRWIDWYNESHVNRTINSTPKKRFDPSRFTPLPGEVNLDDIFCFKDTRKVDSCNQFSYQGIMYTIPKEHCLVAFKVDLRIHPHQRIRVWHHDKFICELPILNQ